MIPALYDAAGTQIVRLTDTNQPAFVPLDIGEDLPPPVSEQQQQHLHQSLSCSLDDMVMEGIEKTPLISIVEARERPKYRTLMMSVIIYPFTVAWL